MNNYSPRDCYTTFFQSGEVTEIRAFGLNAKGPWEGFAKGVGIVSGYFDNPDDFAKAAYDLARAKARGIYFTLNPVHSDFLARAANRLKAAGPKTKTTSDENTKLIRWLPIDFDPKRKAGGTDLNTSEDEFRTAWEKRNEVHGWLRSELGFPDGVTAISGNGAHLLFRLPDLENTAGNVEIIKQCLQALDQMFTTAQVDVDVKVFNPARIWKTYGTVARKSDHTEKRPQRQSYIQHKGDHAPVMIEYETVGLDKLSTLASMAPAEPEKPQPTARVYQHPGPRENTLGPLDLEKYLSDHGVTVTGKGTGKNGSTKFHIEHCVFDPSHAGKDAVFYQDTDGKITYNCFHQSCAGKTWHDVKAVLSGDAKLAQYCVGYDANWTPPPDQPKQKNNVRPIRQDPREFARSNKSGGVSINQAQLANVMEREFAPIHYIEDHFKAYNAEKGFWETLPEGYLRRIVRGKLGNEATPNLTGNVVGNLADQTYKRERDIIIDPYLINCKNGMVDIRTAELYPHDPKYNSSVQIPCSFNPDAECPRWAQFLSEIFLDDPEKANTLQDFFGYCLFPKILFPGVIFAIGGGGNGKGVTENTLINMIGKKNVSHISLSRMNDRFGPVHIRGKLLNSCSETESQRVDVTTFKQLSAGDEMQTERKHEKNDIIFTPFAKHFISMNALPSIGEKTASFFRRVTVLEYNQNFSSGANEDTGLKEKLQAEIDGIFYWSLTGLARCLGAGQLSQPASVIAAKERFRKSSNPILTFVEEECLLAPDAKVPKQELFKVYQQWSQESGTGRFTLGKNNFYEQIRLNFPTSDARIQNRHCFVGIGVKARF